MFVLLEEEWLILDACCAITLAASGFMAPILAATGKSIAIASYVMEQEIMRFDLRALVETGVIQIVDPETDAEADDYVEFATELDDGEAVTSAIAGRRNWIMATDERKAIATLARKRPLVKLVSTPDLVKNWVDVERPAVTIVRAALLDIRVHARYVPHPQHPLQGWWQVASS